MTLAQIQYFYTLAETEHMRRAAEKLFISQPSLSVAVQKLEEELGLSLFERSQHRLRLTREGEIFRDHCRQILQDVDMATVHMKRLSKEHESKINLGCIDPLLHEYLPVRMRRFLAFPENRDVEFDIREGMTEELITQLQGGMFDFLICMESEQEGISQLPLVETPLVLIRHPDMAGGKFDERLGRATIQKASPYNWQEIAEIPMLGYSENSSMDEVLSRMWLREHIYPAYRYRLPNENAILALVANGFGYAVIPKVKALSEYAVDVCPLPSGNYSRTVCITTLEMQQVQGASGRFLQYIADDKPESEEEN